MRSTNGCFSSFNGVEALHCKWPIPFQIVSCFDKWMPPVTYDSCKLYLNFAFFSKSRKMLSNFVRVVLDQRSSLRKNLSMSPSCTKIWSMISHLLHQWVVLKLPNDLPVSSFHIILHLGLCAKRLIHVVMNSARMGVLKCSLT